MDIETEVRKIKWYIVGVNEFRQREEQLNTLKSGCIFRPTENESESTEGLELFIKQNHPLDSIDR